MVSWIIRFEGLLIFLLSLYAYYVIDAGWLLFVITWLLPDIGMIGYLKDKKFGSLSYNFTHTYLFSLGLIVVGYLLSNVTISALGVTFTSHIALDRFLGFGLKYKSGFKDTHIQKL